MAIIKTDIYKPNDDIPSSIGQKLFSDYNTSGYVAEVVASRTYSDLHNSVIHPIHKDALRATDLDAIYQSIKNIIMTPRGTRPFNLEFGSAVWHLLFEPVGWPTIQRLQAEIKEAVSKYESRISNLDCKVEYDESQTIRPHHYIATIVFQPYFGGLAETSFILQRIR